LSPRLTLMKVMAKMMGEKKKTMDTSDKTNKNARTTAAAKNTRKIFIRPLSRFRGAN
jgi:hypothetical protein